MKKGTILKANINFLGNRIEQYVLYGGSYYILENGSTVQADSNYFSNIHNTRNVPPNVRKLFEERYKHQLEIDKINNEIQKLEKARLDLNMKDSDFAEKITNAKGLLSKYQFISEIRKYLPSHFLSEMQDEDFNIETPYQICALEKNIYISHSHDIEKWVRKASFLYEEYDGTIHFYKDYEKNAEYNRILNNHSRRLNSISKKAKFIETLSFEDKGWLTYNCAYEIDIKKPLTKEYAKEIAKMLVA